MPKKSGASKNSEKKKGKKSINLALQGGGSHGAFTWGVLQRFLDEDAIEIDTITGTSAGAMNGALLVYGFSKGGKEGAKRMLEAFWKKISTAASLSPLQTTIFDKFLGNSDFTFSPTFHAMDYLTKVFSPAQLNILDINPLRDVLSELINFPELRKTKGVKLFVNATNVKSGKIKVFDLKDMTVEMLLASACMPFLSKTVEIDGQHYWDGGYSGNPAIYPAIYNSNCTDVVIVQINPINIEEVPTKPNEILDRVNEISFNSNLMREVRAIDFVARLIEDKKLGGREYKNMKLHMIEAEDIMAGLGSASKLNADWDFLVHLKESGWQAADDWLKENFDKIGVESSIDIRKMFLE